eukprot:2842196-Ditylum_brightwellii.AAC.1
MKFYHFLLASISEAAKIKLLAEESNFHVNGVPIAAAFFKLLMEKTVIDIVVTTNTYRTDLQELDSYMVQVNSDVVEFNSYGKNNLEGLRSRGEKTKDLMINLFKGYKAAKDA